ncbi:MAG: D-arabitol-phosphate dehydrogenase [Clostridia bacterium]|nr:D-arabitol-phosphate dehydrogenase [Clostridia bacterium]
MEAKIKAGAKIKEGPGNFSVIEIDKPQLRDENDVLFRVTSVGMCGTDVSIYKWTDTVAREYHPQFPLVIGHEMSGIVEEVGSNVTKVKVGDHITVNEHIFCGKCEQCQAGRTCICEDRVILGCHVNGAMTEYIVVRQENCFKLPDNVPHYAGSIAEPLSVAVHAIERVPAHKGDIAVVFGVGTIGLGVCLVLLEAGATVIAVGVEADKKRLEVAKELGAIPVTTGPEGPKNVLDALQKLGKKGADLAYECSGAAGALINAVQVVKAAGTVCEVGIPGKEIPIDIGGQIVFKEKTIVGSRAFYHSTWEKTMELLERSGDKAEKLITHRLPLEKFEDAIHLITSGECIKAVVCPSES